MMGPTGDKMLITPVPLQASRPRHYLSSRYAIVRRPAFCGTGPRTRVVTTALELLRQVRV